MSDPDGRRPRRVRTEASETQEPPALSDPSPDGTETLAVDPTETQANEMRKRPRAKKPELPTVQAKVGAKMKVSVWLPAKVVWQLRHHMADQPGVTEGQVIAPLLEQYLGGFDYPKRPDWLLAILKGENPVQDTSAA